MDNKAFDELSRKLAASGSRRGVIGALVGLTGAGILGAEAVLADSKQQRRRQRRRNKQDRSRDARIGLLGFWFEVINPLDNPKPRELAMEFGDLGYGQRIDDGICCPNKKTAQVDMGEQSWYATKESGAYIWLDNKYFIYAENPIIGHPYFNLGVDGSGLTSVGCCHKPLGRTVESNITMSEAETRVLNFEGYRVTVNRNYDLDDYKFYTFIVDS